MKDFKLDELLKELCVERKIFNSEADFQFALAWKIKENYKDFKVFLEYYFDTGESEKEKKSKMYVDIMLKKDDRFIPIELKYRKKKLKKVYKDDYSNQEIFLTEQSAQDQGRYWFLYDVHRIEKIKDILGERFEKGYAVFLTNDKSYKTAPTKKTKCYDFRIDEKRGVIEKNTFLNWAEDTAESSKGNGGFELKNNYYLNWENYSILPDYEYDDSRVFNYLLIPIE
ncbi:MAG: hypothetical protein IJ731_10360 [Eubacterium sp.]|nr:hypothetical protein [Eubacterium sp.]